MKFFYDIQIYQTIFKWMSVKKQLNWRFSHQLRFTKQNIKAPLNRITTYHTHAIIARGSYIFYPVFSAVYNEERLILQTIYVLNKEVLNLKAAVYSQERFQTKSGL